jgi:hypothetical protein
MKRILAATLFLSNIIFTHAIATPLYAGIQIGDNSVDPFLGYQINRMFAVEAHYSKSNSNISHAGVTVDTSTVSKGIVGIATFPMKLHEVLPYDLFIKAGYMRTNTTDTYSGPTIFPSLTPNNGSIMSQKNQLIIGGGAEYDFYKNLTGRVGLDFQGHDRFFNLSAIFKF